MKTQSFTHWKKTINPNYFGTYSLEVDANRKTRDKVVQIKSVSKEIVKGPDGREEECTVAQLVNEKPLILNKTNCKTITNIYDTPYVEEWSGKKITLYSAKVKAFGDNVDAIRIRVEKPKLPDLTPASPKWDAAREALKNGSTNINQIRANYTLSSDNQKLLEL